VIDALSIRRSKGGSVLAVGVDRASVVDGERMAVVATAAVRQLGEKTLARADAH